MRNEMKLCGFLRMLPLMLLVMMATTAGAQQADARTVIAESESIHTANGMEVREAVKISGIPQWITVRGKDLDNPLLLYIHGGPGDTMMGVSWTFQRPWEDYYHSRPVGPAWFRQAPQQLTIEGFVVEFGEDVARVLVRDGVVALLNRMQERLVHTRL